MKKVIFSLLGGILLVACCKDPEFIVTDVTITYPNLTGSENVYLISLLSESLIF